MKKDQIVVEDDITYQRKNFYEQCLDRISWYTDDNQFGMIRTLSFLFDIKISNFDDDAAFIVKEKIYKYDFSNYKTLNDLITDLEFGKFSQGW